jgi:hypothetical protein
LVQHTVTQRAITPEVMPPAPPKQNGHAEPVALTLTTPTPLDLLRIAVSQNADIEKLSRLMELQERWEKREAWKAYVVAMNSFKAAAPRILKNKHVNDPSKGPNGYDHATLDQVCDAVISELSKHGISHGWKVAQPSKDWIQVTCVLTHAQGHSEETTLEGPPDQTGSKNNIQAVGSTVTYLERYTLLARCGLAAANTDTDGVPVILSSAKLPGDRIKQLTGEISSAKTLDQLWKAHKAAYREAYAAGDQAAIASYVRAKDIRKAELKCQPQ